MMSVDADGNPLAVQDLHATGFSTPVADVTQDVVVNSQGRSNGISWFTFERNLTNCHWERLADSSRILFFDEFTKAGRCARLKLVLRTVLFGGFVMQNMR